MICSGQETLSRVYFERLLSRPEYILKDSWQGADAEHMEIKDPHVGTVFGPFCGPITEKIILSCRSAVLQACEKTGRETQKRLFSRRYVIL